MEPQYYKISTNEDDYLLSVNETLRCGDMIWERRESNTGSDVYFDRPLEFGFVERICVSAPEGYDGGDVVLTIRKNVEKHCYSDWEDLWKFRGKSSRQSSPKLSPLVSAMLDDARNTNNREDRENIVSTLPGQIDPPFSGRGTNYATVFCLDSTVNMSYTPLENGSVLIEIRALPSDKLRNLSRENLQATFRNLAQERVQSYLNAYALVSSECYIVRIKEIISPDELKCTFGQISYPLPNIDKPEMLSLIWEAQKNSPESGCIARALEAYRIALTLQFGNVVLLLLCL
jgi:hypothetical protein